MTKEEILKDLGFKQDDNGIYKYPFKTLFITGNFCASIYYENFFIEVKCYEFGDQDYKIIWEGSWRRWMDKVNAYIY